MKRMLFFLLVFSNVAIAQPALQACHSWEIGRGILGSQPFISLMEFATTTDTSYALFFQSTLDLHYSHVQKISFRGAATLNDFYTALTTAMAKNRGEQTSFMLGDTFIKIQTSRVLGSTSLDLTTDKGTFSLDQWNLRQLFGKS